MNTLSISTVTEQKILEHVSVPGKFKEIQYHSIRFEGSFGYFNFHIIDTNKGEVWKGNYTINSDFHLRLERTSLGLLTWMNCPFVGSSNKQTAQVYTEVQASTDLLVNGFRGTGECILIVSESDQIPEFELNFQTSSLEKICLPHVAALCQSILSYPSDTLFLKQFMGLKCEELYLLLFTCTDRSKKTGLTADVVDKIQKVKDIIRDDYTTNYTIKDLGRLVYLNITDLKRFFKEYQKVTIHQYSRSVKMAEALRLLSHTDKRVNVIAADLGFSSISSFSAIFKKVFGYPPGKFRNRT